MLHGFGQSGHPRVIDAILRHVNLLQAAHQLRTQIVTQRLKHTVNPKVVGRSRGSLVRYLEGLSEGSGCIVLQAVPPCNKHLEAERSALCTGLFMALDQRRSQDLSSPTTQMGHFTAVSTARIVLSF